MLSVKISRRIGSSTKEVVKFLPVGNVFLRILLLVRKKSILKITGLWSEVMAEMEVARQWVCSGTVPTPMVTVKVTSNEVRGEGIMDGEKIIDWGKKMPIRIGWIFLLWTDVSGDKSSWIWKIELNNGGLDCSKRRSRNVSHLIKIPVPPG
ncbi:hypothetical protein CEXT_613201 [Caerostris extrusa]|uniref:Uncharacterized protein n=1 Tax=Caerostris extrusa TaxID=172846 RepID=A0AAV4RUD3_CAEEX|nr:hypothetical protein CEXT_613201 [Caerostris extrusa]